MAGAEVSFPLFQLLKAPQSTRNYVEVLGEGLRSRCEGGAGRVGGVYFRSEGKELVMMEPAEQTQAAVMAFNYTSDLASGAGSRC